MNQKIKFDQIINAVVEQNNISKTFARSLLKELTSLIQEGLLRDNVVNLAGFGIFKLHRVPERTGRNVRNGESIFIPAHRKVLFKPEKHLRELINRKYENLKAQIAETSTQTKAAPKKQDNTETDISLSAIAESLNNMIKEEPGQREQAEVSDEPLLKDDFLAMEQEEKAAGNKSDADQNGLKSNKKLYIGATLIAILLIILLFTQFGSDEPEKAEIAKQEKPAVEKVIDKKENIPKKQNTSVTKEAEITYETISSVKGDNLWKLAYRHYKDGYLWPLILQANKARITNPDLIEPGEELQIPVLKDPVKLTKEENRLLSNGHLTAYFEYKGVKNQEALNHLFVADRYDHENVKNSLARIDNSDYQSIQNLTMK